MEILLTKSQQKSGLFSSTISFILHIQARLTEEEAALIKKYKMGSLVVYDKNEGLVDAAQNAGGWRGLAAMIALKAMKLRLTVDELVNGRSIEIKDINEMMSAQEQIKQAAAIFHAMLIASANFEGEELITF